MMDKSQPELPTKTPSVTSKTSSIKAHNPAWRLIGSSLLFFVVSFFGAWAALSSGLVHSTDTTLTEKRNVVSREGEVVADVAKQVSPSVVSILTESQASLGLRSYTQQSAGTGIIIGADGYVLTNKHVVADATDVEVVLADGTSYKDVKIIGTDPVNDLAFLKIKNAKNLKAAVIGDSSKVNVGEKVIAIGNALGQYQTSVTSGIISGLGRPIVAGDQTSGSAEQLSNLLQTDAAINPGNSGGPLVDLNGRIIGINTAVDQNAEGIGFAIPVNDAKGLIETVTKSGKLQRAFLGVSHVSITADIAEKYQLPVKKGAYVTNDQGEAVVAGSPADKTGLREGDIITDIDGVKLDANHPLLSAISAHVPGDTVTLVYLRDGKSKTVQVTLTTYPIQ